MASYDDNYVLITPARNEEGYIEKTIQAVVSQAVQPIKWIIISDGSTDGTNDIVSRYEQQHDFIEVVYRQHNRSWNFGSKAKAITIAYEKLKKRDFAFVGNLDADITFDSQYYQGILVKFRENHRLGIAGGMIAEFQEDRFEVLKYNLNSVAGAVQLFRRECYEQIGGYLPMKYGGIDAVAEIMARMHGWEVRSFQNIVAYHHRRIGATNTSILYSKFRYGMRDYSFGTHPVFMIFKSINRFKEKPYIVGGVLMFFGYLWELIKREKHEVPDEVALFLRKEQMKRMARKMGFK